jgi:ring-1,2-phenylacetyl-CoA epoxidase subunit PaaC
MSNDEALKRYLLRLGDNALVLAQRLSELVTAGPELEEELATANFALDYLGQARMFYSRVCDLGGSDRSEDDLAFLRGEREFENLLLVEQPNGHFGDTIVRQVLFDCFYRMQLESLSACSDPELAAIASRAYKEIQYHVRHAAHWLVRLGDGTEFSHVRVAESLQRLWRYTGEMFAGDDVDNIVRREYRGPDLDAMALRWRAEIEDLLAQATLPVPDDQWMDGGGRQGRHSEHFGYLLAEMQYMQRSFPGASW